MGHCWRCKGKLISNVLLWTPSHGQARVRWPIYNSSILIQDVAWKTYQEQWMIGMSGRRGSGKSVQVAHHDDDDDDIYIYICVCVYIYIYIYVYIYEMGSPIDFSIWWSNSSVKDVNHPPSWFVYSGASLCRPARFFFRLADNWRIEH